MSLLVLGLALLLGAHSTRIIAEARRAAVIARIGTLPWKALVGVVSIVGLVLIVHGYAAARAAPVVLWPTPGPAVRHIAALLTLVAFVLVVAAYVPRNHLKRALHHPMVLGVKLWAFAHLLANNTLADLVLFGTVLAWAVLDYRAARQRDRASGVEGATGLVTSTLLTVAVGVGAWAVFALVLHAQWIGVAPFGR